MNFEITAEFKKDFKKLAKKYKSLDSDLETFKKTVVHVDVECNKNFAVLHKNERLMIIKARFYCKYLKGKTLRIVYAHYVSVGKIVYIELFFKGNKGREDASRIKDYLTGKL